MNACIPQRLSPHLQIIPYIMEKYALLYFFIHSWINFLLIVNSILASSPKCIRSLSHAFTQIYLKLKPGASNSNTISFELEDF